MNCRQIRQLLPLYADGDLEDRDLGVVSAHLEGCEECRARLAVDRELTAALAEMSAAPQAAAIAPAVRRGVMARVEKERRWGPLRRRAESLGNATVWVAVSAVTALLLVALAITWRSMIERRARQDATPAAPYARLGWEVVGDEVIAAPYYWVIDSERVDRTPQLSPDGTQVAYLPTVDGATADVDRLVVRDLPTGQDLDLTPEEGYSYTSVRWSPDSRSLAFVKYRYAEGQAAPTEVWRIDADGRNLKLLYRLQWKSGAAPPSRPTLCIVRWSADGRYVEADWSIAEEGGQSAFGPPVLIRADGSGVEERPLPSAADMGLSDDALVGNALYSPTGHYLLHVVRTDGLRERPAAAPTAGHSLLLYDLTTKRATVLASAQGVMLRSFASISPDGEWIVFQTFSREDTSSWQGNVWVVRRDGSGLRQVMYGDQPLDAGDGPFWADGGRAYFEQPLYVSADWVAEMDAQSGEANLITPPWHIVDIASVSRDGRRLLAVKARPPRDHELHLLELAPGPAPEPTPVVEMVAGLVVEEHAVARQEAGFPTDVEGTGWLGPEILDRRRSWREPDAATRVAASNEALRPFGYRLVARRTLGHDYYGLYRGEELLWGDITFVWPVAVSSQGDDFALLVEPASGRPVLVRPGTTQDWDLGLHAYQAPVLVGQDLVSVENDEQHRQYAVRRGDEIVYTFAPPADVVTEPTRGLWSWEGHWVLEVNGQVLVDGRDLNQELGCDEVFGWRPLQGTPFYFFRQGESVGVSYNGQVLPQQYEQVIHYQCCSGAAYNAQGNDTMVWFFGLRGGTWYYVEMGIYGPTGPDRPAASETAGPAATATPALSEPTQAPTVEPAGVEITVYFTDRDLFNAGAPPFEVAVHRVVAATANPPEAVLQAYFEGPTAEEQAQGLEAITSGFTGYSRLEVQDGIAHLYLTGPCVTNGAAYNVAAPLIKNLLQFEDIRFVKIYDAEGTTQNPQGEASSIPVCLEP